MRGKWITKPLGEIAEFQRGLTYSKKDEVDSSSNIVLRANNIDLATSSLDLSELRHISDKVDVPASKKLKCGSLLICTASGSKSHLGKVALVDHDYGYAFGGFMGQLTAKPIIDSKYLFYFMISDDYKEHIRALSDGVNINNLRFDDLKPLEVPLPLLPEQQRIVAILDEAFAGLATATANAEKNLKNAHGLFESYLRSILTSGDDTWEQKRLPQVAQEFGRGKSKHRPRNDPKLYGGPYPFVQTGDISNADHWLTDYTQTYSTLGLAQSRLWPKGTVCTAIVGATVGETAILNFEACFPDSVIGLVVNEAVADNEYVEYLLQAFKAVLKEKGKGTARDNINLGTFEKQLFPFPTIEEQRTIVARLNDLAARKGELKGFYTKRLETISELRQSILQKAFSGELTSPPSQAIKEAAE